MAGAGRSIIRSAAKISHGAHRAAWCMFMCLACSTTKPESMKARAATSDAESRRPKRRQRSTTPKPPSQAWSTRERLAPVTQSGRVKNSQVSRLSAAASPWAIKRQAAEQRPASTGRS